MEIQYWDSCDNKRDQDVALNARLAGIFTRLDKIATITDKNMVDLITSDIDATRIMKHRRQKNKRRIENKGRVPLLSEDESMHDDDEYSNQDDKDHR